METADLRELFEGQGALTTNSSGASYCYPLPEDHNDDRNKEEYFNTQYSDSNFPNQNQERLNQKQESVEFDADRDKDIYHFANNSLRKALELAGYNDTSSTEFPGITTQDISIEKLLKKLNTDESSLTEQNELDGFYFENKSSELPSQLENFWKFYTSQKTRDEKGSEELKQLLMPITVLCSIEALVNRTFLSNIPSFVSFFNKCIRETNDEFSFQLLHIISKARTYDDLKTEPNFIKFISEQCSPSLSYATFKVLRDYLEDDPSISSICRIFSEHIKLRIDEEQDKVTGIHSDQRVQKFFRKMQRSTTVVDSENLDESKSDEANFFDHHEAAIEILNGTVHANLPSISVFMTNGKPSCSSISEQGSLIAFGMATAGIRIFARRSAIDLDGLEDPEIISNGGNPEILRTPVVQFNGHAGGVYALKFHPKSRFLFSTGEDSRMRCWQLPEAMPKGPEETEDDNQHGCKVVYKGHSWPIWCLDISQHGNYIATGSMDRTVRIWIPSQIEYARLLVGHYMDVNCVQFHPNEAYIASGSVDRSVRLWDINSGSNVRMFSGSSGPIRDVVFHQSGKFLFGCNHHALLIWDINQGELITELPCPKQIKNLSVSNYMCAASCLDGSIQFWNLRNIVGTADGSIPPRLFELDDEGISIPQPISLPTAADKIISARFKSPTVLLASGVVADTTS